MGKERNIIIFRGFKFYLENSRGFLVKIVLLLKS